MGLALAGLCCGLTQTANATGAESALTVTVTVVRPCMVLTEAGPNDPREPSAHYDMLAQQTRAALETSCVGAVPRVAVLEAPRLDLDSSVRVLDIEL